jgi:hypothetical protein
MKRFLGLVAILLAAATMSFGQAISVNGGSIQGTVTDPSGAVVAGASVKITSDEEGSVKSVVTSSAGVYSVGPLNPGPYSVTIVAGGFENLVVKTTVRTGTVTSGNFRLTIGKPSETIEVNAGAVQLNTEQAGISDVISHEQIQSLPINGRNFLDVAQILPGVILQNGESFDPTKAGYSALSTNGVSGRTTRILLDGQDITDETVGTTIFNVSQGAVGEFQLNRSTQDVSGEVTSQGLVLVSTQTGTNHIHGQAFFNFQDYRAGFADVLGIKAPFQRNQFGGSVGGPIFRDKLFFFANAERIKQDSSSPVAIGPVFPQYQNLSVVTPYRETYSTIRLDYNGPHGIHFFVRGNYDVNAVASSGGSAFQVYANRDNTPGIAGGADFQGGHFTHSFRGSYEKFHNLISDASQNSLNLVPGVNFQNVVQGLETGANDLAPQGTFQSDKQFRYDGTWLKGRHSFSYGYSLNRIQGGGFAAFFGLAPRVRETSGTALANCGGVAGAAPCLSDPVNGYHASSIVLGNGLGFFTENPGFGLIGGGVADWREGAYVSDSVKLTPNFTLTAGVRWSVDTGRANQDLATPLCSDIDTALVFTDPTQLPCTGSTSLFSQWRPDLGAKVHQPYGNFGPQIGFAYALPDHKTVLNGAYGIFYEGDVFNNTTNARTDLLKSGAFFNDQTVCGSGVLPLPDGTKVTSITANGSSQTIKQICAGSIKNAGPYAIALQNLYQTNSAAHAQSQNGSFVGETLSINGAYGAPYRTPYSQQWNFGVQRELFKGATITANYAHNSTIKIAQTIDVNHVGAARFLNTTAAKGAIAATTAGFNCTGGSSAAAINCAIKAGAQITDFANNGLDSGTTYLNSQPASAFGLTANEGAAFPGQNPLLGLGNFLLPIGKSGYDALSIVYREQKVHPVPGIESTNIQVSYTLSSITVNSGGGTGGSDAFFSSPSFDNDNPSAYMGPAGLDHRNQVTFGSSFVVKYGARVGIVGHFYSAAPTNLFLDAPNTVGNIFQSDVTGDGTTSDLAPGTLPGAYMRSIKPTTLGQYITNFNNTVANNITPAGQALVTAGLFTPNQLVSIGGAIQPLSQLPQARALGNSAIRTLDMNFTYPIHLTRIREGLSLEPGVSFYNIGNLANFGGPSGTLQNVQDAGPVGTAATSGSVNGVNSQSVLNGFRVGRGSGTFDQNGPRSTEFQLKLNF